MNKPLKLNKIIGRSGLSRLLAQVHVLTRLEQRLQLLLPEALRPHCHVLAVHGHSLVLAADSPVWAARLRFHTPQLLPRLAEPPVVSLRVRVLPAQQGNDSRPRRISRPPGRQGAATLRQAARTVSDPALKSALLRLAGNDSGR